MNTTFLCVNENRFDGANDEFTTWHLFLNICIDVYNIYFYECVLCVCVYILSKCEQLKWLRVCVTVGYKCWIILVSMETKKKIKLVLIYLFLSIKRVRSIKKMCVVCLLVYVIPFQCLFNPIMYIILTHDIMNGIASSDDRMSTSHRFF